MIGLFYLLLLFKKILNLREGVGMGVRQGKSFYLLTDEMMTVEVVVPTYHFKTFIDRKGLRIRRNVTSRSPTVKSQ